MSREKKIRRLNRTIVKITMLGYSTVLVILFLLDCYMIPQKFWIAQLLFVTKIILFMTIAGCFVCGCSAGTSHPRGASGSGR